MYITGKDKQVTDENG